MDLLSSLFSLEGKINMYQFRVRFIASILAIFIDFILISIMYKQEEFLIAIVLVLALIPIIRIWHSAWVRRISDLGGIKSFRTLIGPNHDNFNWFFTLFSEPGQEVKLQPAINKEVEK